MLRLARHLARVAIGLMPAITVAACTPPIGPPPITSIEPRACTTNLDTADARPLVIDPGKAITVVFDALTPCWADQDGTKSVYSLFSLPASDAPYLVYVTSQPIGQGILPPRLLLMNENGQIVREIAHDTFMFHGIALKTGFQVHSGERFLMVASDPKLIGQTISQVHEAVIATSNAAAASGGVVVYSTFNGVDATVSLTYALNGTVIVSAQLPPKAQ